MLPTVNTGELLTHVVIFLPETIITCTAVLLLLTRSIGQTTLAEGHLPVREYQLVPAGEH